MKKYGKLVVCLVALFVLTSAYLAVERIIGSVSVMTSVLFG